jgi:hypothetical protein
MTPGPLLLGLVAVAALVVIAVALLAVKGHVGGGTGSGSGGGKGGGGNGGGGKSVSIKAASAYDPQGNGAEHDSDVPKATDGSQSTFWTTEHYSTPDFGGLKDGVGLVLNATGDVKTVRVTTDTPGFTAELKRGSSAQGAQTVGGPKSVSGTTTFDVGGGSGSVYVLWITHLASGGDAHVNEVTAAG